MRYQRATDGVMLNGYPHAFDHASLLAFRHFLRRSKVVPVREAGREGDVVLRHDVDHNLDHALLFAEWEASQGFRATYYVLPAAWYWAEPSTERNLLRLEELGHEVGVHQDAVAEAWRLGFKSPVDGSVLPAGNCDKAAEILADQIAGLRALGITVSGTSTHGTGLWKSDHITNCFLWAAGYTAADFGLEYADAYHLHRKAFYVSDNRGGWSRPLAREPGHQLHVLTHPCHWDLSALAAAA